jgi:hypothetical protein
MLQQDAVGVPLLDERFLGRALGGDPLLMLIQVVGVRRM